MRKAFKILSILLLTFLSGSILAQNGINSPYSQFGIGEMKGSFLNSYTNSMGGLSYTVRNNFMINTGNPASYTAIDTNSFVFDIGLEFDFSQLSNNDQTLFDADGGLSHLTFGFPIFRWWKTSIGLIPWSDVSYKSSIDNPDTLLGTARTVFDGNGGVNKIYWGNAFAITQNLSFGFNTNFLFGNITRAITYEFPDSAYVMNSMKIKETSVRNVSVDLGLQYTLSPNDMQTWIFGLTASLPFKLNVEDHSTQYTFLNYGTTQYVRDTVFPIGTETGEYASTLELPLSIGFGIAFVQNDKWMVGADFTYSGWNGAKYTENENIFLFGNWDDKAIKYVPNYRVALGFEKRSDRTSSKYYQRMSYRAGVHCEIGKTEFLGQRIDDYGVHCGLSFPVRKLKSFVNLNFQYGSYGKSDVLCKKYAQIGISLSTSDTWFKKRKYE